MDLSFLTELINVGALGICLCVGYIIKQSLSFVPNKYIPLIMACLGCLIVISSNLHEITVDVILSGMISGLASTGLYETFRNLINKDAKKNV